MRYIALLAALCVGVALSVPAEAQTKRKQKPPKFELNVVYLTKDYERPLPLSLTEPVIEDDGLQGARLGDSENQNTGRMLRHAYSMQEEIVPEDGDVAEVAEALLSAGERLIVADLTAPDLLALADLPEAAEAIIFNVRAPDDRLRNDDCRTNVYHVAPSYAMKADGLMQFLAWKRWRDLYLVRGKDEADVLFADALKRSAKKFGLKLAGEKDYAFEVGARRVESGHQQIQTQMPMLTNRAPDFDVLVVSDMAEKFGVYLPYNTKQPRPVVGTHGLESVAWHRSFEQFGSMSLHSAFEKQAGRYITERDYLAWLGVKMFAEAAMRSNSGDLETIRAFLTSDDFVAPGFKGVGLSFRKWNHQLRQPMLIAWREALISVSPQEEFLHRNFHTDTLGFDEPESTCDIAG